MHQSLALYSGGLGVLSGDHCKSASDLGLPFVAVGLLYRYGYFRQAIDADGYQQHIYPEYELHPPAAAPGARRERTGGAWCGFLFPAGRSRRACGWPRWAGCRCSSSTATSR